MRRFLKAAFGTIYIDIRITLVVLSAIEIKEALGL